VTAEKEELRMKEAARPTEAASSGAFGPFVQRINGKISSAQYVRTIDQRVSERRRDERQHRRSR
jgi:hypothetical protein